MPEHGQSNVQRQALVFKLAAVVYAMSLAGPGSRMRSFGLIPIDFSQIVFRIRPYTQATPCAHTEQGPGSGKRYARIKHNEIQITDTPQNSGIFLMLPGRKLLICPLKTELGLISPPSERKKKGGSTTKPHAAGPCGSSKPYPSFIRRKLYRPTVVYQKHQLDTH